MKLKAKETHAPYITAGRIYTAGPSYNISGFGIPVVEIQGDDRGRWCELFAYRFEEVPDTCCSDATSQPSSGVEVKPSNPKEKDPFGKGAHESGSKLDHGKVRPALVLGGFARALLEVSKVGTYGATKYTDNGWQEVPNGVNRYDDANLRHWLTEKAGQPCDQDTELLHAAHTAWNALARLDLIIRESERAE